MASLITVSDLPSETSAVALLSLVGAFLALFCTVGFTNAFGVFQAYYSTHQLSNNSSFDISWIGSIGLATLFGTAPIAGVLADRIGAPILLLCGSIGILLGVFMTSLASDYYQYILAQAVLLGLSMSFVMFPSMAVVGKNFHKHRGLAFGITVGGASIGGLIWPIVLNQLINRDGLSFNWSIRIVGFIMIPLLAAVTCTVKATRITPTTNTSNGSEASTQSEKPKQDFSIVKNKTFLIVCAGFAMIYLGMFSPFFYVATYSISLGMAPTLAVYMISFINASSLFGRVLPGFLADHYGHFNLFIAASSTSGIVALCWTAAKTLVGVIVWSLAYGFTSGAIMSLQASCVSKIATRETQGTATGFVMGSVALTAAFGTPISGQLVGTYGYLALSIFSGTTLLVGSLLIVWSRWRLDGRLMAVV